MITAVPLGRSTAGRNTVRVGTLTFDVCSSSPTASGPRSGRPCSAAARGAPGTPSGQSGMTVPPAGGRSAAPAEPRTSVVERAASRRRCIVMPPRVGAESDRCQPEFPKKDGRRRALESLGCHDRDSLRLDRNRPRCADGGGEPEAGHRPVVPCADAAGDRPRPLDVAGVPAAPSRQAGDASSGCDRAGIGANRAYLGGVNLVHCAR